jgi:hypothetical protein
VGLLRHPVRLCRSVSVCPPYLILKIWTTMRAEVLVATSIEMKKYCDMTPCSLVVGYYHFEGTSGFRRYRRSSRFIRNDGNMYQITLRHIKQDCKRQTDQFSRNCTNAAVLETSPCTYKILNEQLQNEKSTV